MSGRDEPLVAPFWSALDDGRLTVQRCCACGALRWPPIGGCLECLSRDSEWIDVEPTGTVWSSVTYHRAFQPHLKDEIPYTVAMVQLDAGPYVVGRLVTSADQPAIGDRVTADLSRREPGQGCVTWRSP